MCLTKIKNFLRISARIVSSEQPKENQFKLIAKAGFNIVINLAMPDSDDSVADEGSIVSMYEMIYIQIPVPFEKPKFEHFRKFVKIMNALQDYNIWIDCVANYRVSAFIYLYQIIYQGITPEDAKEFLYPAWKPNDVWIRFMKKIKNTL